MGGIARSVSSAVHRQDRTVLFQEIDVAGVVFFARIFDWFHDTYVACLAARGIELPAVLRAGSWGAPLVHAEADYQRSFRFGDAIAVEITSVNVGEKSITVEYRIVQQKDPATSCATGRTIHAFIDRSNGKPLAVPAEVRAAFA
jgi:1,4-dihydroxy-2-naphthoyl-CoA hydrolase